MHNLENKNSIFILNLILILLPISLLFSNVISEIFIFLIIVIFFYNINKKELLELINNRVILLLLILTVYLIVNYLLNIDKNPSLTRSLLFIRFPLYAISLGYFLNCFLISSRKIFLYWGVIVLITCLDLQLQSITGQNILGYKYIYEGSTVRLGGFLNDELKIAYFINSFFVISLGALSFYEKKKKVQILSFLFIILVLYSVFLTGERANFICLFLFTVAFLIFSNLKKYFLLLAIIIIGFTSLNLVDLKKDKIVKRMIFDNAKIIKDSLKINDNNKNNFLNKDNQYFAHYSTAWEIFKDYPILGVGLKNFRVYCNDPIYKQQVTKSFRNRNCSTHPHNFYFEILSELGIIGTAIILSFFLYFFYICIKSSYKKKCIFLFSNTIFLTTYFIPFLPRGSFFTNWNSILFWTVIATSFYLINRNQTHS